MNKTLITNNTEQSQNLARMGWSAHFSDQIEMYSDTELSPARVIGVYRNGFRVSDGQQEWHTTLAGRLRYDNGGLYPATGDWVIVSDAVICAILVRKNALSRGASGTHEKRNEQPQKEQIIATNLDTVFIVCGLDRDFNLRRIERYLTLIYNCGLTPVIVLTKADLHQSPEIFADEVKNVAFGVPVHLLSVNDENGITALEPYLSAGRTVTLVGSSGAGKSTLVNRLYGGDVQVTGEVSDHVGKGKHTTTSRDLIMMPQGGMLIDNPGIREIAFWEGDQGVGTAFPEIERLARGCRFSDCSHLHEPGCRVINAVETKEISRERLESYRKMKRELEYQEQRKNKSADRVEKERWKNVALKVKAIKKRRF